MAQHADTYSALADITRPASTGRRVQRPVMAPVLTFTSDDNRVAAREDAYFATMGR